MHPAPAFFEQHQIRRVYDEASETWWFSVVDIVQTLTQQPDDLTARKYWNKLKQRLHDFTGPVEAFLEKWEKR